MMNAYPILLLLVAAGLVVGQAPAPAPAPARGAQPPLAVEQQKNTSGTLQTVVCQRALDFVYNSYGFLGNWSLVNAQPQGASMKNYMFCYEFPPVGRSSNDMTVVLHYLGGVGLTVTQLAARGRTQINNATGTSDSIEEVLLLARGVEDMDGSYWAGTSTIVAEPVTDIHLLGNVIYGKSAADLGKKFLCGCILNEMPNPSSSPVATQPTPVVQGTAVAG